MIVKSFIPYRDNGVELEAFAAYPANKKSPLVILCHAWRGRDSFICERADRIAELGYAAIVLDMYGKGVLGNSIQDNAALKKPFIDDRKYLQRRLLKGYEVACGQSFADPIGIVVVGFGFGGLCALDLARSGVHLNGAVSIYGHFDAPIGVTVHPITAKVLVLHGYNDPVSTVQELEMFQKELDQSKVDWQSHLFGNTYHAFGSPTANSPEQGIVFNPVSAEMAWRETESFIRYLL